MRLRFADVPCHFTQYQDVFGNTYFVLRRGARQTQFLVSGDTDIEHHVYLSFLVESANRIPQVERVITQFSALIHDDCSEAIVPVSQFDDHLRSYIIALDGHLAGRSYREIARVIYGSERVKDVWTNESRFLKDRVRRAVVRGTELMNGGYLELLKGVSNARH